MRPLGKYPQDGPPGIIEVQSSAQRAPTGTGSACAQSESVGASREVAQLKDGQSDEAIRPPETVVFGAHVQLVGLGIRPGAKKAENRAIEGIINSHHGGQSKQTNLQCARLIEGRRPDARFGFGREFAFLVRQQWSNDVDLDERPEGSAGVPLQVIRGDYYDKANELLVLWV